MEKIMIMKDLKEEIKVDIEIILYQLPIETAFNFVDEKFLYPFVTSPRTSTRPKHVRYTSLGTGIEYNSPESLIVEAIFDFTFSYCYDRRVWVNDNRIYFVDSVDCDELGRWKSFTISCGKAITISIPSYAECVFEEI